MKKQGLQGLASAAAAALALSVGVTVGFAEDYSIGTVPDADRAAQLLNAQGAEDLLLGTASLFSVFVEGDFGANGSDCEGRLAAGGAANISTMTPFYHVGMEFADYASEVAMVIVGEGPISNFTFQNEAAVVIGKDMPDENVQLDSTPVLYRADLIDCKHAVGNARPENAANQTGQRQHGQHSQRESQQKIISQINAHPCSPPVHHSLQTPAPPPQPRLQYRSQFHSPSPSRQAPSQMAPPSLARLPSYVWLPSA